MIRVPQDNAVATTEVEANARKSKFLQKLENAGRGFDLAKLNFMSVGRRALF